MGIGVLIIGKSGSGKSTSLRIIMLILKKLLKAAKLHQ